MKCNLTRLDCRNGPIPCPYPLLQLVVFMESADGLSDEYPAAVLDVEKLEIQFIIGVDTISGV